MQQADGFWLKTRNIYQKRLASEAVRVGLILTRLHHTIISVMNSCIEPRIRTRFFVCEEHMSDHERDDDNNQDDSETYLTDEDGGDLNELAAETSSLAPSECSSFVCSEQTTITAIRVRPMLPSEKKNGYRVIVDMSVNHDGLVTKIVNPTALPPPPRDQASARYTSSKFPSMESTSATDSTSFPAQFTQEFWFDYSYWSFDRSPAHHVATQSTIYDELGVLALQTVLQGHNCSIFAYGQPSAGKTYTMMGSSRERTSMSAAASSGIDVEIPSTSERRGLIPRICQGLFAEIDEAKRSGYSNTLGMSYVEIYDERVYDLLSHATIKKSLKVREHPEEGAFVERAQRAHATSYTQVLELIEGGNRSRCVTSMHSSCRPTRSHTVLIISLTQNSSRVEVAKKSKLCLVDLAGSEKVDHSGSSGSRLREAASVNRSLATLADVVGALSKCRSSRSVDSSQHQKTFVPYRNSVLTRLLKECLGGRAKTIMIGAISPCCAHYEESIATLRYIERARSVYSTIRMQADSFSYTTHMFLGDVDELKSNLCAANNVNIPSKMYGGTPEHFDDCLGCESCDDNPADTISAQPLLKPQTKLKEIDLERTNCGQNSSFRLAILEEQSERLVSLKSVHLLNLVAIRRRWQKLRQYRAFDQWRKCVSRDANITQRLAMKLELNKINEEDKEIKNYYTPQKSIGRKPGCPPLHTRVPSVEARTTGRVQDVVAAVVAADAICCSVVQDFLFPHHPDSTKRTIQQSNLAASASLLELLASSSEFDGPAFCIDLSGNYEPQLEELASPEDWCDVDEGNFNFPSAFNTVKLRDDPQTQNNESVRPLLSPEPRDEESTAQSALSLCVDSIDMARRALGPGVHKLRSGFAANGTGVECELLNYLDKRLVVMTRSLEDLLRSRDVNPGWRPGRSICDALETMMSEFCLQIIARLCEQLPSATSACVAGRLQLETQLEHFSDRLKGQLLPAIARGGDSFKTNSVFVVATELLVMTEIIKLVWSLAGHKKRERLLRAQALEAAAIKGLKMAAKIAALEERNSELTARCDALLVTSGRLNEAKSNGPEMEYFKNSHRIPSRDTTQSAITLEQVEVEYDEDSTLTQDNNLEAKLQVEAARTREVQAQNDELLSEAGKNDEKWQSTNAILMESQTKISELSTSLLEAKAELSRVFEKAYQAENDYTIWTAIIEDLKMRLCKAQTQRESAEMHVEDSVAKHAALIDQVSIQADRVSALEGRICHDKQRLLELEASLAVSAQERDEHTLLLSLTEEALANALDREKMLQSQLAGSSVRESEELIRVRVELHESTLELASMREELAELLDHSTLQSDTIEGLQVKQTEALQRTQEAELQRDQLLLRCQSQQDALEHEERAYELLAQQSTETLSSMERQQEIERQECMAVHETLQRQTNALYKIQARQCSIKMDYCSTIRDLKTQVEALSTESRALNEELEVKAKEMEAAQIVSKANELRFEEQAKLSASVVRKQEEIARNLDEQLYECRVDLKASISRWVRAETQSGLLRVCVDHMRCNLSEAKEVCMMQLADTESADLRDDSGHIPVCVTSEIELTVNEHLSSLDAWFDEVISGNGVVAVASVPEKITPESTNVPHQDLSARSSLLRTLMDLSALTNELLVVCESSSDSETRTNNSSAGHPVTTEENSEPKAMAKRKEKASSEVVQLRKFVMKMKEALDAKDDMLLFLDGKVRRLEQYAST